MESDAQREARRAMSGWLTEQINNFALDDKEGHPRLAGTLQDGLGTMVRAQVLASLENLDKRFAELNTSMRGPKYNIRDDRTLVKFYMKGGNAFKVIVNPGGKGAKQDGGGDSDWDTQVVIDPWAPTPLIDTLYGLVEDIVLDEFRKLGSAIAQHIQSYFDHQADNPPTGFEQSVRLVWGQAKYNLNKHDFGQYGLTLDNPQRIRRVFDHDKLGLWFNDSTSFSGKVHAHPEWVPGISFNEAIKPFSLYRLGFTWHAETVVPDPKYTGKHGTNAYAGNIEKPILMELIDITIPRKATIESVRVWEEIVQQDIVIAKIPVTVQLKRPAGLAPEAQKQLSQANLVISEIKNETVTTKKLLFESDAFQAKKDLTVRFERALATFRSKERQIFVEIKQQITSLVLQRTVSRVQETFKSKERATALINETINKLEGDLL